MTPEQLAALRDEERDALDARLRGCVFTLPLGCLCATLLPQSRGTNGVFCTIVQRPRLSVRHAAAPECPEA
ncbi:MAG: hypothetical protein WCP31_07015 [Chloroflexales bacterium]